MTDFLGQMLRRSRHEAQERKRFYASLNDINPTSLASLQASQSRAAVAAASSEAALRASMAAKVAADAKLTSSAVTSSVRSSTAPAAVKTITSETSSAMERVAPSASASSSSSSLSVLPSPPSSSSSAARSSSSSSSSSSSAPSSSSVSIAGRPVMTITQTPSYIMSSASASSAVPSASAAAASTDNETTGMSTGGVIGAVAAGLVGLVIIGALCGWLFRKHSARKNSVTNEKNWRQINDDSDGYGNRPASPYQDDIYGQDAAPVIGSRRALALARANAHDDARPPTMMERNIAGAGAWNQQPDYGPYPTPGGGRLSPEGYGMDPHSRPYMQQAGRVPIIAEQYQYQNAQPITPDTGRQLISPLHPISSKDPYSPSFVPGRPGVPQTDRQIAQHEDFADFPSAALGRDELDQDWAPHTATTNGDWANQAMPTPSPSYGTGPQLPMLPPMSPDGFGADFAAIGQSSIQKQVYADVARAAGVMEPITPTPSQAKYAEAAAASSSSRGLPPLPVYSREAPSPFQHGRPLSALEEVETPLSTPLPSTGGTATYGQNPFDDMPVPPARSQSGNLAQPQAPSTPISAARFPPPGTPGVPQSVTSSPMRGIEERTGWHSSPAPAHRLSHMTSADDDDVYGGI